MSADPPWGVIRHGAVAALLAVLLGVPLAAQSNDEIQTGTQLNFSTPGARSLALGGAFVGLADDATAAYVNPAGLTQLVVPEASVEGRAFTFESLFTERGHTPLYELTGIGIDTVDGLAEGGIEDRTAGVSFLSYVHPIRRFSVAVYRHEVARFEASLLSQGLFFGRREVSARTNPSRSHFELDVVQVGVAAAWRVTDALSLGLGVATYSFTLDSFTERFQVASPTGDPVADSLTGQHFGPADFRAGNVYNSQVQAGDDQDVAFHAGVLWKASRRWSAGAVYRQGPAFAFDAVFVYGPAGERPGEVEPTVGGAGTFRLPDVAALGVAFRPADPFVFTFDVVRVEYSDMTDELTNLLTVGRGEAELYRAEDVHELRLGFEYQGLHWRRPVALRLGVWRDGDHRIRYFGERQVSLARFRAGREEIHVAGGLGVVLGRLQLDVAVDFSDPVDTVSLSTVVRLR